MLSWFFLFANTLNAPEIPNGTGNLDLHWHLAASKAAFDAGSVTHVPADFLRGENELDPVGLFKNYLLCFAIENQTR